MQKIFLIFIVIVGLTGCAESKRNIWINPNIPMSEQSAQYYRTLNLCQNVANGAYQQDTAPIQRSNNMAFVNPSYNAPIQAGAYNLSQSLQDINNANAQFAQTYRWVQIRNDCMRGNGWILATQAEADTIARNIQFENQSENEIK